MLTPIPLSLSIPHAQRPYADEGVLMFYDGPLLFWLPHTDHRLLAVSLETQDQRYPCLVVAVDAAQEKALLENQLTIRRVFGEARHAWRLADYGADELVAEPLSRIEAVDLPGDVMLTPRKPSRVSLSRLLSGKQARGGRCRLGQ